MLDTSKTKFCHLHLHTHYSLLDGLNKPLLLMKRLNELGMDSVAITDHGNMFGAIEFYKEAKANGIKPIIGCEVYVCNDRTQRTLKDNEIYHLTLLCMNEIGYKNLIKLVSLANLEGFYYKPRIDFELLKQYNEGLICLSGCLGGELSQFILNNDKRSALNLTRKYLELFGDRYYIEIQRHPNNKDQSMVTPTLINLAKKLDIPVVATTDPHFLCKEDRHTHEVLLAVNTGTSLDDKNRFSLNDSDIYVASPDEMMEKFKDIPEAITNTQVIVERCNLEIELDKIKLPRFDTPPNMPKITYLSELCNRGRVEKGLTSKEYLDRLNYELDVIEKTGFATYLLIVWDMIRWAKENDIVVGPGRGSAAGSLISYCLGITNVDPIKYGLLFERFLNPDRIAPPDIDIDFEDTRRSEVIEYVANKYGKDHVAQIATFGTMYARSSIRDTGRALGYDLSTCDRIAKMIPFFQSLTDTLNNSKELQQEYQNQSSKKLIDMAIKLEGVVRHAGTHACGIVISDKPIDEYMPVMLSKDGNITAQYDMNIIGDLGLLKMDFLGLRNLSVISNTQKLIKKDFGVDVDINNIPLDDKKTFKLLQLAKTTSVFQLESDGMKRYLKKLKPTSLDDITAMVSLYRPGPMELISEYINRKYGKSEITYLHPLLEPVLKDTYGIMIYQEQLIKAVQVLADFTLAEADVLRKAVGKKIKKLLDEQEDKFKNGCEKNGIPNNIASEFWALVEPFNRYGFNKSHAVCYAIIGYQTAYLKANYPLQFMVAEINSNTDINRIKEVLVELKNMGIQILPPKVNTSDIMFINDGNTIVFGLSAIKGMGTKIVDGIIEERNNGEFVSLEDFVIRNSGHLNKKVISLLAQSGAIDDWGNRTNILSVVDSIAIYGKAEEMDTLPKLMIPKVDPPTIGQKLVWEKELLGSYISANPARNYHETLKSRGAVNISELSNFIGKNVTIGGVVTSIQKKVTKAKRTMYITKIEDITGEIEMVIFDGLYNKNSGVFVENNVVTMLGNIKQEQDSIRFSCLRADKITSLI